MGTRIVLGVSGSVAASAIHVLVKILLDGGHEVFLVYTEHATHFMKMDKLNKLFTDYPSLTMYGEDKEWIGDHYVKDQVVTHVLLAELADVIAIVPASLNTMAKIRYGFSDNLLTSVVAARPKGTPLVIAPAMNTNMWINIGQDHRRAICKSLGSMVSFAEPDTKKLACGSTGVGALCDLNELAPELVSTAIGGWSYMIRNNIRL